ncbi:MAG: tonB-system energizer ExbB [Acetobacteraceae bacterium]
MRRLLLPLIWLALSGSSAWAVEAPARSLPTDLSPLGMFLKADIVVQAVMAGLAFAAALTWLVLFAKKFEILRARRRLRLVLDQLKTCAGLGDATQNLRQRERVGSALVEAARDEVAKSGPTAVTGGIRERITVRMARIEAAAIREISLGVSLLATIGATAPFVGLFGTVWGIMNSFIGISKSQSTSLAVVAPGIAEALLATAIGLVAAIPAVVFYNHLGRSIGAYRALLGDAVALVTVLASRDLDQPTDAGKSSP